MMGDQRRPSSRPCLPVAAPSGYAGVRDWLEVVTTATSNPDWLPTLKTLLQERRVDLDHVLQRIVDEATRELRADRGTLYLLDAARRELVSRVAHLPEISEIRLRLGEGVAGWVAETRRSVKVPESEQEPRFAPQFDAQTGYETQSLLAVPLVAADTQQVLGVLQLLNSHDGAFSAADQQRLEQLAGSVAELLTISSLGSQLRHETTHPLSFRFNQIVGDSPAMRAVYDRISRAAPTDANVLLRGESGSGKELVARAVHDNSARSEGPFVVVDLAALPPELIENELFGHTRGAFTGADRDRPGKIAAAQGGTLFLDEMGEATPSVQQKLLRLIQERTYFAVGSTTARKANVRFVAATHRDLEAMVAAGTFRQDLYYRLRVVEIGLPALRARGHADLDRLIDHFLFQFARRHNREGIQLSSAARARLHAHPWPGNVRELQHCLESTVVMSPSDVVLPDALPLGPPAFDGTAAPAPTTTSADPAAFVHGETTLREAERAYIAWVLERHGGNKTKAAAALDIGRNTLLRKLKDG